MNNLTVKTLQSATIGPSVPCGHFLVKVHSVFRKAINLQLLGYSGIKARTKYKEIGRAHSSTTKELEPTNNINLITILSCESLDYPQGIRLDSVENFADYNLTQNGCGNFGGYGIILKQPNTTAYIYISFSGANKLKYESLPHILCPETYWQICVNLLAAMQDKAMVELHIRTLTTNYVAFGTMSELLTNAALNLGESLRNGNANALRNAVSRLVGLGPGLTPSGDDFLCGFLAAAHCQPIVRVGRLPELNQAIMAGLKKTNSISATFLHCAINGEVCCALYDFAKAISSGVDLNDKLNRLCTIGHSSGMDIATGFLYGLKIWKQQQQHSQ